MQRQIIHIDQEKCDGCGICVPDCPEGAIRVIDGKARLISDIFCDGLGACIGNCPRGAITTEVREAEPYDEARVMENIIPQGENTIRAHLQHLNDHGLTEHVKKAVDILEARKIPVPEFRRRREAACPGGGYPGAKAVTLDTVPHDAPVAQGTMPSRLNHWPVQLHLINPDDPGFENADCWFAPTAFLSLTRISTNISSRAGGWLCSVPSSTPASMPISTSWRPSLLHITSAL